MAKKKHNRNVKHTRCDCTNYNKDGTDQPKYRKSINDMNEKVDTDDNHTKILYKTNVKNKDTQSRKKNFSYPILSKSQGHKKSENKSIINLYGKNQKIDLKNEDKDMHLKGYKSPIKPEPKIERLAYNFGTGDVCAGGPCTKNTYNTNAKYLNKIAKILGKEEDNTAIKLQKQDNNKNKVKLKNKDKVPLKQKLFRKRKVDDKEDKIAINLPKPKKQKNTKDVNLGKGDHAVRNTAIKTKTFNHTCECNDQTGEPFFEIKVDKHNMHVLNADEVKYKVKSFGRLQSRLSCICPTRRGVCANGICEAKRNKQTNFDCRCITKNHDESKPLFEVKLDPGNMNIVNTTEILDIFNKSNYLCPTGICSKRGKHNQMNCNCINTKIVPKTMECTEKTCRPRIKCTLANLCSRVFSRCENWNEPDINGSKRNRSPVIIMKDKTKSRTRIHRRNDVNINFSMDRNQRRNHKDAIRTKARKDMSDLTDEMETTRKEILKTEKNVKKKKKKKKITHPEHNVQDLFHALHHKQSGSYFRKFLLQCLRRKRKRCQKKIKEHEKTIDLEEKKAIKENQDVRKKQLSFLYSEGSQWNCLTKFIAGLVNMIVGIIKNVISATFSLIFSPIKSLVYIKRRFNDPNGSMSRLGNWIHSTWGDRSNAIARKINEIGVLNVIADHFEDTRVFDVLFADKGKTKEERNLYKERKRKRIQRMQQRHNEARFGCRHILLTTLRKTPCLWCYYVCPDLYPACLGLISFMKTFFHVIIYLLAFICWTPCIVSFEVCRACLCCCFCTG